MRAWRGFENIGSEIQGMEYFASGDFENTFQMTYNMEQGLKELYMALAAIIGP